MGKNTAVDVLVDNAIFAESPRWHDGAFWFSDIGKGTVNRVSADGHSEVIVADIPAASGLGWTKSGDLLIASIGNSTIYKVGGDGKPVAIAGPEQHGSAATNDMATAGSRSYISCAGHVFQMGDDEATLAKPHLPQSRGRTENAERHRDHPGRQDTGTGRTVCLPHPAFRHSRRWIAVSTAGFRAA